MSASELYSFGSLLGEGHFSKVFLVKERATNKEFAAKVLNKHRLCKDDLERIDLEIALLKEIQHPNIIQLHAHFEEEDRIIIITELCEGGELFESILEREQYCEQDAQTVLRAIASAVACLHDRNVIHRDLKPENILFTTRNNKELDALKVCDFGFARRLSGSEDAAITALGTKNYIAPEIIARKPYGKGIDVWAFGALAYVLLCGYPPFYSDSDAELFRKIKVGEYSFANNEVSPEAREMISMCLQVEPGARWTMRQVLQCDWMCKELELRDITPARREVLVQHHKQFRQALLGTIGKIRTSLLRKLSGRKLVLQQGKEHNSTGNGIRAEEGRELEAEQIVPIS